MIMFANLSEAMRCSCYFVHPWTSLDNANEACLHTTHALCYTCRKDSFFVCLVFFTRMCHLFGSCKKKKKKKGAATQVGFCKNEKTFALHRRNPPRQLKKNVHLQLEWCWLLSQLHNAHYNTIIGLLEHVRILQYVCFLNTQLSTRYKHVLRTLTATEPDEEAM